MGKYVWGMEVVCVCVWVGGSPEVRETIGWCLVYGAPLAWSAELQIETPSEPAPSTGLTTARKSEPSAAQREEAEARRKDSTSASECTSACV